MNLDTDEGLRLIENKILEVFCNARTAETLLGRPRGTLGGVEARARMGELALSDLGLDREALRAAALGRRRSAAGPEVEAIRIAFVTLAERREGVVAALDGSPCGPEVPGPSAFR